jgi:hypothetical protein
MAPVPGAISLVVYAHASTTPTPWRRVLLTGDARIPEQTKVRDGLVTVAASDSRVLVAWITGSHLETTDVVGGYALYACAR